MHTKSTECARVTKPYISVKSGGSSSTPGSGRISVPASEGRRRRRRCDRTETQDEEADIPAVDAGELSGVDQPEQQHAHHQRVQVHQRATGGRHFAGLFLQAPHHHPPGGVHHCGHVLCLRTVSELSGKHAGFAGRCSAFLARLNWG